MPQPRQFIPLSAAQRPLFVGVDVGGTGVKCGLVDDLGRPLSWLAIPTEVERGPEDASQRIGAAVAKVIHAAGADHDEVAGVGLATPGTMDIPAGRFVNPPNLPGWDYFPIRDRVSFHARLPVAFANDANAAAYGEFWVGAGQRYPSLVMFTLGTGVGGGIIIGDLSVDGEHSAGSELGHIIIDYHDSALVCSCGQPGHLEAYASATAVIKRTQRALEDGRASSLRTRIAGGEEISPVLVADEAERGDPLAREIVLDTARFLGIGVVSVMHTVDPAAVVFGGAMTFGGLESPLGRLFLDRVRQEVRQRAFPVLAEKTVIEYASLGGDAGYIGAAGIARLAHGRAVAGTGHHAGVTRS